ncbi:hypothetical protein EJ04DRAFT_579842 [Polyplosphaeria fusca]|uniref:Rhodopsin domain-containing protein n=1 Tax=Polyplosphaeria fusca TaxID=682080 RepID=A0A9P4UZP2_9PLEO|nr:hypothetical protein EJ04DRAFT_579842 [Polyplosphaeria fusca]
MRPPLDDQSRSMVAYRISTLTIITIVVGLRFVARYIMRQAISWDDGLMLVAWAGFVAYIGITLDEVYLGVLRIPDLEVSFDTLIFMLKGGYAMGTLQIVVPSFARLSLLAFYLRIFTVQFFRRQALIVATITVAWMLSHILFISIQCVPWHRTWYEAAAHWCGGIKFGVYALIGGIGNSLLDLALILLPVRMIVQLRLTMSQKVGVSTIIVLGGLTSVVEIVRMKILYDEGDTPKHPYHVDIWGDAVIAMALLCANLPILKPLFSVSILPASVGIWISNLTGNIRSACTKRGTKQRDDACEGGKNGEDDEIHLTKVDGRETKAVETKDSDFYPLHSFHFTMKESTFEEA